jgi:C-terminal processing protease CtpA/Prc
MISSPAATGLAAGDEIMTVDGKPAEDAALYELREAFKGAAGTNFTLGVKGKGGERRPTLTLADQV